ncbi:MAG: hypothetical protein ABJA90_05610 [Ginsengibacter sp.]
MKNYEYLHLYLGCNSNLGKLIGINEKSYFIQKEDEEIIERTFFDKPGIKLLLRKISDLNGAESAILNDKGLSIGRPKGFSFSPEAMLYLLDLRIDLFNLINEDLAIEVQGTL